MENQERTRPAVSAWLGGSIRGLVGLVLEGVGCAVAASAQSIERKSIVLGLGIGDDERWIWRRDRLLGVGTSRSFSRGREEAADCVDDESNLSNLGNFLSSISLALTSIDGRPES